MIKLINILFFLPVLVYGQISINYEDIILPVTTFEDYSTIERKLNFDIDGITPVDYIIVSDSHPTQTIVLFLKGEDVFSTDGFIKSVKNDSITFMLKIIRPACCCLEFKEISVFIYDRFTGKQRIEIYKIHQDILIPISDVVFRFERKELAIDSITLYQGPYVSDIRKTNECTGEQLIGNKIGEYKNVKTMYVLYEKGEWTLCALSVDAPESREIHWFVGWVKLPTED